VALPAIAGYSFCQAFLHFLSKPALNHCGHTGLIHTPKVKSMKKYILHFAVLIAMLPFASCAPAYVVRERPHDVVYFRPAAPARDYVWVSGDWVWIGGRYQWHEGHWERPHRRSAWVDGHWQNTNRGYKWVPGHWRRY